MGQEYSASKIFIGSIAISFAPFLYL